MAVVEDVGVAEINIGSAPGSASSVSWGAIIAGAVVAAAVSLILLVLGSGLEFDGFQYRSGAFGDHDQA